MSTFLTNTSTPQDSEQQQFIREIIENAMVLCPGVVRANPTTASIHLFSVDVPIRRGLFQARLVRNDTNEVVLKGERVSSAFEAISMLHVRCIPTDAARCDLNGLSIGELHQQIKASAAVVESCAAKDFDVVISTTGNLIKAAAVAHEMKTVLEGPATGGVKEALAGFLMALAQMVEGKLAFRGEADEAT